jgi:hypothetical protein
MCTWRLR